MKKSVSVRFIAEKCGVSTATVSRVLNNDPQVADATRKLVRDAFETYGYSAARPQSSRPATVGIVISTLLSSDYYTRLANEFGQLLLETGIESVFFNLFRDQGRLPNALDTLYDSGVSGIAFIGCPYLTVKNALRPGIPHVWLDCNDAPSKTPDIYRVQSDHYVSGQLAAHELILSGHVKPLVFTSANPTYRSLDRCAGLKSAFDEQGITLPNDFTVYLPGVRDAYGEARDMAQYLIASGREFDSVFAVADARTTGAYDGITRIGKRIPEDIGLISFDGTSRTSRYILGITSVQQDVKLLAKRSCDQLLALMDGKEPGEMNVTLPTHIYAGRTL